MDTVRAVLIIDLGVELDEGDTLDTDLMTAEIRAFVSQYGEIYDVSLEHDGEEEEEGEENAE